ncbi:MAG: preprotein translocase subunit SecA [Candidatus Saganbacteria bacterium]|nr:preprotein translocase subunit SecA [Candidatus Saganbacteria bacterium]
MQPAAERISSLEEGMKALSDEDLARKTGEFKGRVERGESLDSILPEAFATVREASVRTIGLRHFDVQLMGGMVLHQGKIAEMTTGEGKTLVATLPIYLNSLSGKSTHVITVNDYLAKRDSEWMGPIYRFLGLKVGMIQHDMDHQERKSAYLADVTYGTNNEFGFDYLKDNMSLTLDQCVQRDLSFGIVDEVDSILIDEARTPLIISGMVEDTVEGYFRANDVAKRMVKETKDGEVMIVDEFTGRLMPGRRWSDGLHQAVEAKENVKIERENQTLATITFQNYFRMYKKLAGMTGTAKTEEAEFWKIYGLEVIVIPTNRTLIRHTLPDVIYKSAKEKFTAASNEIEELHKIGRPVLVGTRSIEISELISEILKRRGISHHVLNAKNHEREAEIIARAGQRKAVTISTNMAGRGTDIVLGEGIAELGGLHVIGTERHESRRIDNQLRGRAGRQGDPGSSRFFVALEDELMRLFGSDRIAGMMERLGIEEGTPIEHRLVSRAIENAQKKVEQYHFSMRKQVLEYDDVMNRQREAIYGLRRRILEGRELKEKIYEMMDEVLSSLVDTFIPEKTRPEEWDMDGMIKAVNEIVPIAGIEAIKALKSKDEVESSLLQTLKNAYEAKEKDIGSEHMRELERIVMLRVLDQKWIEQLHNMDSLREGIGLRAYGQRDPLVEYKIEGYGMFQEMMVKEREEIVSMVLRVQLIREAEAPKQRAITYGEPQKVKRPEVHKEKIGRNDPCPCGSGKKYKKCCGRHE